MLTAALLCGFFCAPGCCRRRGKRRRRRRMICGAASLCSGSRGSFCLIQTIHIIRADISTEITPLIGTEKQCEELVQYITAQFADDPQAIWNTNVFGKSLHELVSDGINSKLYQMPEQARQKLVYTLQKIVNEKGGGIICIIL